MTRPDVEEMEAFLRRRDLPGHDVHRIFDSTALARLSMAIAYIRALEAARDKVLPHGGRFPDRPHETTHCLRCTFESALARWAP